MTQVAKSTPAPFPKELSCTGLLMRIVSEGVEIASSSNLVVCLTFVTCIYCMLVCAHMCTHVCSCCVIHIDVRGQPASIGSPFHHEDSGIKLRLSSLARKRSFTCLASSPPWFDVLETGSHGS